MSGEEKMMLRNSVWNAIMELEKELQSLQQELSGMMFITEEKSEEWEQMEVLKQSISAIRIYASGTYGGIDNETTIHYKIAQNLLADESGEEEVCKIKEDGTTECTQLAKLILILENLENQILEIAENILRDIVPVQKFCKSPFHETVKEIKKLKVQILRYASL